MSLTQILGKEKIRHMTIFTRSCTKSKKKNVVEQQLLHRRFVLLKKQLRSMSFTENPKLDREKNIPSGQWKFPKRMWKFPLCQQQLPRLGDDFASKWLYLSAGWCWDCKDSWDVCLFQCSVCRLYSWRNSDRPTRSTGLVVPHIPCITTNGNFIELYQNISHSLNIYSLKQVRVFKTIII